MPGAISQVSFDPSGDVAPGTVTDDPYGIHHYQAGAFSNAIRTMKRQSIKVDLNDQYRWVIGISDNAGADSMVDALVRQSRLSLKNPES